jgi:hypothetical protein
MLLLSACGNPSEKMAEEMVEKMMERAGGGDADVDIDEDSGTVTITGKDGTMTAGGGEERPESAPEDLPSVGGAHGFSWLDIAGSQMLGFEVDGSFKDICKEQLALLTAAGWAASDGFSVETADSMIRSFTKTGFGLMLTCGDNAAEGTADVTTTVTMNKSKSE